MLKRDGARLACDATCGLVKSTGGWRKVSPEDMVFWKVVRWSPCLNVLCSKDLSLLRRESFCHKMVPTQTVSGLQAATCVQNCADTVAPRRLGSRAGRRSTAQKDFIGFIPLSVTCLCRRQRSSVTIGALPSRPLSFAG